MIDTRLITLQDFWYHTAHEELLKRTLSTGYHTQVDRYMLDILHELGQVRIPEFTTAILEDYFDKIRYETVGHRQIKKALLNHIFAIAVKKRLIAENPVTKMNIIRTPYNPVYKLSDDDMQALIEYEDGTILCALLKTQLFSGLSLCELQGLMVQDFSFSSGAIQIQRFAKSARANHGAEMCTKIRYKKKRVIRIPVHAIFHIQRALEIQGIDSEMAGSAEVQQALIFSSDGKTPLSNVSVRQYYRKVGQRTGIDHLTPGFLESNFGLRCASLSLNPKDLHLYLGYNTCYTTSKYYDYFDYEYIAPTSATERYYNRIMEEEA